MCLAPGAINRKIAYLGVRAAGATCGVTRSSKAASWPGSALAVGLGARMARLEASAVVASAWRRVTCASGRCEWCADVPTAS